MFKVARKISSTVLALCLLMCSASAVSAQSVFDSPDVVYSEIQPRYTYIVSASSTIKDNENNTATIKYTLIGNAAVNGVDVEVELQEKTSSGYNTVETFSDSFPKNNASYTGNVDIDSNKTYRVKVTFTVYSGETTETATKYSSGTK